MGECSVSQGEGQLCCHPGRRTWRGSDLTSYGGVNPLAHPSALEVMASTGFLMLCPLVIRDQGPTLPFLASDRTQDPGIHRELGVSGPGNLSTFLFPHNPGRG